jgi:ribosomal protein S11
MAEIKETENQDELVDTSTAEEGKETTEVKEEKPNMNLDGTAAGPSKGFLEKLKDKLTGVKEAKEDTVVEPTDEYGEEISPNFIESAGKAGWTPEQIIDYASDKSNEDLDSSIDILFKKEVEVKVEPPVEPEKKEAGDITIESLSAELTKTREELDTLKQGLGKVQEKDSLKESAGKLTMANGMFDEFEKSFPVFGKTEDLPKVPNGNGQLVPTDPAVKARGEVWERAVRLFKADESLSFKDALTESLEMYEGKHYKDKVKDDVIKGMKQKSEQLTPKKSRKNVVKTYESEEDRKAAVVRDAAEKAGVSL